MDNSKLKELLEQNEDKIPKLEKLFGTLQTANRKMSAILKKAKAENTPEAFKELLEELEIDEEQAEKLLKFSEK